MSDNDKDTPFESDAQIIAAIRDPRYSNDSAYRAHVERRLALTNGEDVGITTFGHQDIPRTYPGNVVPAPETE